VLHPIFGRLGLAVEIVAHQFLAHRNFEEAALAPWFKAELVPAFCGFAPATTPNKKKSLWNKELQ